VYPKVPGRGLTLRCLIIKDKLWTVARRTFENERKTSADAAEPEGESLDLSSGLLTILSAVVLMNNEQPRNAAGARGHQPSKR
jgi:hypothetical protein